MAFGPLPLEFCGGGPPPDFGRELQPSLRPGPGICCVIEIGSKGDLYGASTYEKDGSMRTFFGTGFWQSMRMRIYCIIDDFTVSVVSRDVLEDEIRKIFLMKFSQKKCLPLLDICSLP